jgi:hypothetical protein
MKIAKKDIPTKIDIPGAVARQRTGFGDTSSFGSLGAEWFSLGAGADIAPLLTGLTGDLCHSPHWGFMITGKLVVTYADGTEETCAGNDVFYWPPPHTVRVTEDTELIMFSPEIEHTAVMDHMLAKLSAA